ncbi:MAG: class I SAM-dependent methyltransferase [Desulfomonile tiedjei]|nr:class I SAM-dependent methyltransferase [Desulfomonile tiedjei]
MPEGDIVRRNAAITVSWRVHLSRFLFRLAGWIQSLPVFLMRPKDLIDFTRTSYSRRHIIEGWSEKQFVDSGLTADEVHLLEKMPIKKGRLLLLGLGGGRDAIRLAQEGFDVTGVDFVPEMLARAQANAWGHNVEIGGVVQDISNLDVPRDSYDVVWFSTGLYSQIPTRSLRISLLERVRKALRSDGCVVCQFDFNRSGDFSLWGKRLRKFIAVVTRGNLQYEDGDHIHAGFEFAHSFSNEEELRSEFEAAEFSVHYLSIREPICMTGSILVKGSI